MRKLAGLATAVLVALPGLSHAQETPCLSPAEFSSLAGYALPSAISGAAKRCSPTLAANAFLKTDGTALAQRYATRKAATWPAAKAAFLKLSAGKQETGQVLRALSDESLREMIDVILEGMVSQEIPLQKCGTIDEFVRLLAPLPPENTAELIALTVGLATASKPAKVGKLNICEG